MITLFTFQCLRTTKYKFDKVCGGIRKKSNAVVTLHFDTNFNCANCSFKKYQKFTPLEGSQITLRILYFEVRYVNKSLPYTQEWRTYRRGLKRKVKAKKCEDVLVYPKDRKT